MVQMQDTAVMLSPGAARTLTDNIKQLGGEIGEMLLEAHDSEAWRALDYKSWKAYCEAEFDFSRQRGYQLIRQAKVNRALAEAGSETRVTDREARAIRQPEVDTREIIHEVSERREALKDKPRRSRFTDRSSLFRTITAAVEAYETKVENVEAAEIAMSLDVDSRRALERAIERATRFVDAGLAILAVDTSQYVEDER
jgi:hypothetical protein